MRQAIIPLSFAVSVIMMASLLIFIPVNFARIQAEIDEIQVCNRPIMMMGCAVNWTVKSFREARR